MGGILCLVDCSEAGSFGSLKVNPIYTAVRANRNAEARVPPTALGGRWEQAEGWYF